MSDSDDSGIIPRTGDVVVDEDFDPDLTFPYVEHSPPAKRSRVETVDLAESDEDNNTTKTHSQAPPGPDPRWPVYRSSKLSREAITQILFNSSTLESSKVCSSIPPCPFKRGFTTFVIDLSSADLDDLSCDSLGIYKKPSQHRFFYKKKGSGFEYLGRDKVGSQEPWDIFVRQSLYCHPGALAGRKFNRTIYTVSDSNSEPFFPFAVIAYEAEVEPSKLTLQARGNAKDQSMPMRKTKPSVLKRIRELLPSNTPLQTDRAIVKEIGGVSRIETPSDVPATMQQIRNLSYRHVPDSKRSTGAGRVADPNYEDILKMRQFPGAFVKDVAFPSVPPSEQSTGKMNDIRIFLADPRGIDAFKRISLSTSPIFKPLKMDMTYNCARGLYLTPVQTRDPRFIDVDTGNHPIVPVCFLMSTKKTGADYEWFMRALIRFAELKPNEYVPAIVSDQEPGLNSLDSIEQFKPPRTVRIFCELHLRNGTDTRLRPFGKEIKEQISNQIYGRQYRDSVTGKLTRDPPGLVQARTEFEFNVRATEVRPLWEENAPGFYDWFMKNTGAVIKKHYLLSHREIIGANGRVDSNDCERFNGMIQTELQHCSLAPQDAIRKLEELVDGQFNRFQEAVFRRGTFQLFDQRMIEKYEKSDLQYSLMPEHARDAMFLELGLLHGPLRDPHKRLSITLETETKLTSYVPHKELRRLEYAAVDILKGGDSAFSKSPYDDSMVSVWVEKSMKKKNSEQYPVHTDTVSGKMLCIRKCKDFQNFPFCAHTLAVAEKEGKLADHLDYANKQLSEETLNQSVVAATRANQGGRKRGRYRRKGGPQSGRTKGPTSVVDRIVRPRADQAVPVSMRMNVPIPTREQLDNLTIRTRSRAQPWHNDHPFILVHLEEFGRRFKPKSKCISCDCPFPTRDQPPENYVFVHYESFYCPPKDGNSGGYSTFEVNPVLVHSRYSCLRKRYPYASYDLLRKDPDICLTEEHSQFLKEQFGREDLEPANVSWSQNPRQR